MIKLIHTVYRKDFEIFGYSNEVQDSKNSPSTRIIVPAATSAPVPIAAPTTVDEVKRRASTEDETPGVVATSENNGDTECAEAATTATKPPKKQKL